MSSKGWVWYVEPRRLREHSGSVRGSSDMDAVLAVVRPYCRLPACQRAGPPPRRRLSGYVERVAQGDASGSDAAQDVLAEIDAEVLLDLGDVSLGIFPRLPLSLAMPSSSSTTLAQRSCP